MGPGQRRIRRRPRTRVALAAFLAVAAFGLLARPTATVTGAEEQAAIDLSRLPVGDGKIAGEPAVGTVWPCSTAFGGGGAARPGPWLRDDGTFDFTAKAVVDGQVDWPHRFTVRVEGDRRLFEGNGLPAHPTGVYPIDPTSEAYRYDRNPNRIAAWTVQLDLPALPAPAEAAACLPTGPIGVLLTGGAFFNALDAPGRDALAHEVQDGCQGHPEPRGVYHYHSLTTCLDDPAGGHSPRLGWAFDGFGLYGHHGEGGATLTNADLDACHGHTHAVEWNGETVELYHYHATWEYPYTLGCFRGVSGAPRRGPG